MKVLLDECLPKRLKRSIVAENVITVPEAGWASKKNGELLRLAEAEFDIFLTNDRNLEHQQNLSLFNIAVIVIAASTNDVDDLLPLVPAVNERLATIKPGEIEVVSGV